MWDGPRIAKASESGQFPPQPEDLRPLHRGRIRVGRRDIHDRPGIVVGKTLKKFGPFPPKSGDLVTLPQQPDSECARGEESGS